MNPAAPAFDPAPEHRTAPRWPAWTHPPEHLQPAPGPAGVAEALAWLETRGEQHGWPLRALMGLALCADEALTNIASYARRPDGQPARLWLACGATEGDGLALCIEDDGAAFDPTAQVPPALATSLDEARIGGHGLRLMHHYLRQLRYRREGGRNVLLLEVQAQQGGASAPLPD